MHEMALAEGIMQIVEDQANSQNFAQVKTVWLEIGELSHVNPDAIRFCFDAVAHNTIVEGAHLEIDRVPGKAWCHTCARTVKISNLVDPCPLCDRYQLLITGGEEMRVCELEVD